MNKLHVKTGDTVILLTGDDKYRGKTGKVLEVSPEEGKVIVVEGQSEPEESYQNMIDAFNASNIKGLKEFIKG